MEWTHCKVSDLAGIIRGGTPKTSIESYWNGNIPWLSVKDFSGDSKYVSSTEKTITEEGLNHSAANLLDVNDIVISARGTVGELAMLSVPMSLNQSCFGLRPKCDADYLYYLLKIKVAELKQRANGGVFGTIIRTTFDSIKCTLPLELKDQHRIASILSTYDSLIENNTKRIRLLEKMAENIYKEWFVRFRFPGHENVEMENGLPKGWKRGSLSDVCEFKRGKNITSSEMQEGNVPVISAGLEPSGYHSCSNVRGVNVTMSSSGANAGYIAIHYSDIWAADCSYIEESTTGNIYYVYELLNNIRTVINNFQRGAAQPHVYPKDVNRIKLILPSENLMQKANARLEMMHKEIHNLQHQNSLLARQRDLLLPRLMSGKLEVKEELLE